MNRRIAVKRAALGLLTVVVFAGGSGTAVAEDPLETARDLLLRVDNFSATGISPTSVFLFWQNVGVANKWRVEGAQAEEGPYSTVATAAKCCSSVLTLTPASDTTVRWLRVIPLLDDSGLEGKPSIPDPVLLGPQPPTGLTCNDGPACLDTANITLKWTDNSDEQVFWIMRARGTINPNFGSVAYRVLPENTTMFDEILTEFATTFMYKVVAVRERNIPRADGSVTAERAFADGLNPKTIRVDAPPLPPPADPSGLTASFTAPSTAVLTWTDNAPGADGFEEDGFYIEWGPTATSFEAQLSLLPHPGKGTMTYVDATLEPDKTRCFRVRAYRFGPSYSGYDPHPTEPGVCVGSIPKRPTELTALLVTNSRVDLAWLDNSDAESKYVVQRCDGTCTSGSAWTELAQEPADTVTFSDLTVTSDTTYSYRVYAENSTGKSATSNILVVTTPRAPLPSPANLTATGITSHKIELSWDDRSTDETGFRIEFRAPVGEEWFRLVDVGANTTTYVDAFGLGPNETRCYRVRALKGTAESDPSNEACDATLDPEPPDGDPTGLTATAVSNVRTDLRWTDTAANEDGFRVEFIVFQDEKCTGQNIDGIPWSKLTDAAAKDPNGTVNLAATPLLPGSAYFWRVRAFNADGISDPSNVVCSRTLGPPRPVWEDPDGDDDLKATRCSITLRAFEFDPDNVATKVVERIRVQVIAALPTGHVHDTPIVIEEPTGAPKNDFGDEWKATYKFLKGPTYRLIATAIGPTPNSYASADRGIGNMKVLADCPTGEPDPLP